MEGAHEQGVTVEQFRILQPRERAELDPDRLEKLYEQLGPDGAEDVVCRALEEVALRLSHTEKCYCTGHWEDMRKSARSLIAIADQIGMGMLARVARDVTTSIDAQDGPSVAATLSRLLRIGDLSLNEIWDLQDKTL